MQSHGLIGVAENITDILDVVYAPHALSNVLGISVSWVVFLLPVELRDPQQKRG